jgi:hypothetical protein
MSSENLSIAEGKKHKVLVGLQHKPDTNICDYRRSRIGAIQVLKKTK